MYADHGPCATCGGTVVLQPRSVDESDSSDEPVGPASGVVGDGDPVVDRRVCTNPDCETHDGRSHAGDV